MNERQIHVLKLRKTDINDAMSRFCGDEQLYILCMKEFLKDKTLDSLHNHIKDKRWEEAFVDAHALKGMAGNMGFYPLMHSTGQLILLLRSGRVKEISKALEDVNSSYRDITDGINDFLKV